MEFINNLYCPEEKVLEKRQAPHLRNRRSMKNDAGVRTLGCTCTSQMIACESKISHPNLLTSNE